MKALIAKKIGMTQIVTDDGKLVPVSVLEAEHCVVTQIKTAQKDGYSAVQLGFGDSKRLNKAQKGHLKVAGSASSKLREVRLDADTELEVGAKIGVDSFTSGDPVTVSGVSKGKGFAGTIKRHNFSRGPETHGSRNVRAPGSIGSVYPQRVIKGKKMPGHMGVDKVTVRGLKVAYVDVENNLIAIRGAVPGANKSLVKIVGV